MTGRARRRTVPASDQSRDRWYVLVNIIYLMRHVLGAETASRPVPRPVFPGVESIHKGGIFSRYGPKNGISQSSPNSALTKPMTERNNAVR